MNHADHEWAKEQIPAHLAGGLSADERARLEAHAGSCAECIAELDAARRFDRQMDDLFSGVRPGAGFEERLLRRLRTEPTPRSGILASRGVLAAAAVVLLGILGFIILQVDAGGFAAEHAPMQMQKAQLGFALAQSAPPASDEPAATPAPRDSWGFAGDRGRLVSKEGVEEGVEKDVAGKKVTEAIDALAEGKPGEVRQSLGRAYGNARGEDRRAASDDKVVTMYVNKGPAHAAVPDPGYFKPGELAAADGKRVAEAQSLKTGLAAGSGGGGPRLRQAEQAKGTGPLNALQQNAAQGQPGTPAAAPQAPEEPQAYQRKIIRTGEIEYEIESFDAAVATISKLVEEEKGFIATLNSDKLPNGKVRGTVVLRVPPDRLDTLLLKLRGMGELKTQNIRSQDVGKQYYDLESRLRAARTMEERLLKIIKEGKGEIKDLIVAERELGEWRTKIESYEGEKRYYDSQISLSTITVTLVEKEIRSPFAVIQTERVNLGLEVEDVEKAHKEAIAAVNEAKGRITKSDLKQLAAGQYTATLHFEVAPSAAGPLRDRFRQLGNIARLDIDRVEETEGGSGKASEVLKVQQKDTQFFISIYNLANIAPRETNVLSLACTDPEASFKAILTRVRKAAGRVVTSSLNRQKNEQTTGEIRFEVKAADAEAVLQDVRAAGEVIRLDVNENPDTQNVTASKQGFQVQLLAMGLVEPRETATLELASNDVPEAYRKLVEALGAADARILAAQLNENDRQNVRATLSFDVRRDQMAKFEAALAAAGEVTHRTVARAQDVERVVDSKKRFALTLLNVASIRPRETDTVAVEVDSVDAAVGSVEKIMAELGGRVVDSHHKRGVGGHDESQLTLDIPLAKISAAADRIKVLGTLRVFENARNPQAPEGELARGRIDASLFTPPQLVAADSGPWARIKSGLSVGLTALSWSLTLVIVGLCFVLPIGLIGWGSLKIYRKAKAKAAPGV